MDTIICVYEEEKYKMKEKMAVAWPGSYRDGFSLDRVIGGYDIGTYPNASLLPFYFYSSGNGDASMRRDVKRTKQKKKNAFFIILPEKRLA